MDPLQFFKCLADDTRLKILLMLHHEGELCVCELCEALEAIQPKISRHLALLRDCELIQDRRQGQWVFYRLHDDLPDWCHGVLEQAGSAGVSLIETPCRTLYNMSQRPQRCV